MRCSPPHQTWIVRRSPPGKGGKLFDPADQQRTLDLAQRADNADKVGQPLQIVRPAKHHSIAFHITDTVGLGDSHDPLFNIVDDIDFTEGGYTGIPKSFVDIAGPFRNIKIDLEQIADNQFANRHHSPPLAEPVAETDQRQAAVDIADKDENMGTPVAGRHRPLRQPDQCPADHRPRTGHGAHLPRPRVVRARRSSSHRPTMTSTASRLASGLISNITPRQPRAPTRQSHQGGTDIGAP